MKPAAVRNTSRVEQYVIIDGRRHAVAPYQIKVFDADIATAFLERCAPHCISEGGINSIDEDQPFGERVWLYNLSGNPDVPQEITIEEYEKGKQVKRSIPNPQFEGRVIGHKLGGGEKIVSVRGEVTSLRYPPRQLMLYPWTRKAFEKEHAEFFLKRENEHAISHRLAVRSRAPSGFEPNDSWELNDLVLYAKTVDSKCIITPTTQTIEAWHKAGRRDDLTDRLGFDCTVLPAFSVINQATGLMMRRIFFRVANPLYPLPSRSDFESIKENFLTEPGALEPEKLPSKRGRPRNVDMEEASAVA